MRVIKLGGRAQSDPRLPLLIRNAWNRAGGRICVVHGGGDEITALQAALGKKPAFVDGRRITNADDLQLLRMTLSGVINKRLVSALNRAGVPSLGISGEDGQLITARRGAFPDLGAVGIPEGVNSTLLESIITAGYMPVISPVATDLSESEIGALNVNGDDAAAAIAEALGAAELLFVADVKGVMSGDALLSSICASQIAQLTANGIVRAGMAAKLDAARNALAGGVERVRISDLEGILDESRGTTINPPAVEAR